MAAVKHKKSLHSIEISIETGFHDSAQ